MSLFIASLNSGSNGNCYYVGNNDEGVLVDVGISCREVEKRMARLELSLEKVKAIFISHEHSDHIRGLSVLSRKFKLPVYITPTTLTHSKLFLPTDLIKTFAAYKAINIGKLSITAFPKMHDASDPYSFIVSGNGIKIGVLTDIGLACEHVIRNFKECNAAFLEANYDDLMLEKGNYPYYLKNRISSDKGHLSNSQALEIFVKHKPKFMSHLILSHLSKDNNCPNLVRELFLKNAQGTNIIIASRYNETNVYEIALDDLNKEKMPEKKFSTQTSLLM
ncbi:MAG: MBL fold metallo-hydrolase [Bacteroidota bacterium]|nr:MBL fold metallo-hydrolase [Bacteroidota bacterium]MDP3144499.1 MBL fold metallo-hydrolase [Bacteroidota bacterium]